MSAAEIAQRLLAGRPDGVRSDARRNVLRLVEAARVALDEVGLRVTSHEIARRAGVGIGTFYRQVGSLDELLGLLLVDSLGQLVVAVESALAHSDPWQGFVELAVAWVRLAAESVGLREVIEGRSGSALAPALDPPLARIRLRLHQLVRHAQRAGVLRVDVTWRDVASLLTGATPVEQTLGEPSHPDQWRRNVAVLLSGLRAATGTD